MGVSLLSHYITTYRMYNVCNQLKIDPNMNFLVDGHSLIYYLYKRKENEIDWTLGGEYSQFQQCLIDYISVWRDNGVKLCIVFDGCVEPNKLSTSLKRTEKKLRSCELLYSGYHPYTSRSFLLPAHTIFIAKYTLLTMFSDTCTVIQAAYEADPLISKMAQSGEYNAIISNDSDFMIYQLPKNIGYVTLECIQFVQPDDKSKNSRDIYLWTITNDNVAQILNIDSNYLPLVSCLAGNDYINKNELQPLHSLLIKTYSKKKKAEDIFPAISKYIKSKMNKKLTDQEQFYSILKSAYYHITPESKRVQLLKLSEVIFHQFYQSSDDNCDFHSICPALPYNKCLMRPDLRSAMMNNFIICDVPMEPNNGIPSQLFWQNIRKKLYSLIFFNRDLHLFPSLVQLTEEVWMTEFVASSKYKITSCELSLTAEKINTETTNNIIQLFCDIWGVGSQELELISSSSTNDQVYLLFMTALFKYLSSELDSAFYDEYQLLLHSLLLSNDSPEVSHQQAVNRYTLNQSLAKAVSAFSIGLIYIEWTAQLLGIDLAPYSRILLSFSGRKIRALSMNSDTITLSGDALLYHNIITGCMPQKQVLI
jgi:5'-3' exonuclease